MDYGVTACVVQADKKRKEPLTICAMLLTCDLEGERPGGDCAILALADISDYASGRRANLLCVVFVCEVYRRAGSAQARMEAMRAPDLAFGRL